MLLCYHIGPRTIQTIISIQGRKCPENWICFCSMLAVVMGSCCMMGSRWDDIIREVGCALSDDETRYCSCFLFSWWPHAAAAAAMPWMNAFSAAFRKSLAGSWCSSILCRSATDTVTPLITFLNRASLKSSGTPSTKTDLYLQSLIKYKMLESSVLLFYP